MYKLSDGTKINLSRLSLTDFFSVYNQHEPHITEFKKKYCVSLVEILDHYYERPTDPPMIGLHYVFDDNLGGYTIDAVKKSLEEWGEDIHDTKSS